MVSYLVKRILFLVLLLGVIAIMPFAAMIGILIYFAVFGISIIGQGFKDGTMPPFASFLTIIGGIVVFFFGFRLLDKIAEDPLTMQFFIVASCCVALIAGGFWSKDFVHQERQYFYMDERIDAITKCYPPMLAGSGIIIVVLAAVLTFLKEHISAYSQYLEIGVWGGALLAAVAVVFYIIRMVHIFLRNK